MGHTKLLLHLLCVKRLKFERLPEASSLRWFIMRLDRFPLVCPSGTVSTTDIKSYRSGFCAAEEILSSNISLLTSFFIFFQNHTQMLIPMASDHTKLFQTDVWITGSFKGFSKLAGVSYHWASIHKTYEILSRGTGIKSSKETQSFASWHSWSSPGSLAVVGTSLAAFQTHCQHVTGGLVSEASASSHYRTFSPTLSWYCWQTQQCVCLVTARELPMKNPIIPHRTDGAQHILMQLSCATSCVDVLLMLISARSKCGQAAGHQRLNPTTPNFNLWLTSHLTSPYEIVIKNLGKKISRWV